MTKKKILVLCDAFAPPAYGPRVRNLCDYLSNQNYDVTLFCEKNPVSDSLPFAHKYNIQQVVYYKKKGIIGKLEWGVKFLLSLLVDHKNYFFYKTVSSRIKHQHFDLVFCTTFHTFPLYAAQKIAHNKQLPLCVDLRDIAEQCSGGEYNHHYLPLLNNWINNWFRSVNIKRRNKILKKATIITTVSKWHTAFLKQYNDNVQLVYNGYDDNMFFPESIINNQFIISYTGKLYGRNMQDPTLFFEALGQLKQKQLITSTKVRVQLYVSEESKIKFQQYVLNSDVADFIDYKSYVPTDTIPSILRQSSIILVCSNTTTAKGPHGIMTTKFYEALGVEKPVLCVRSDEGCLAQTIQDTNAGIAATTVKEVEQFILEKYSEWKQNGFTHQPINVELKKQFSRQEQAKQLEDIFILAIQNYESKIR